MFITTRRSLRSRRPLAPSDSILYDMADEGRISITSRPRVALTQIGFDEPVAETSHLARLAPVSHGHPLSIPRGWPCAPTKVRPFAIVTALVFIFHVPDS